MEEKAAHRGFGPSQLLLLRRGAVPAPSVRALGAAVLGGASIQAESSSTEAVAMGGSSSGCHWKAKQQR